jgi:hypothetical protein
MILTILGINRAGQVWWRYHGDLLPLRIRRSELKMSNCQTLSSPASLTLCFLSGLGRPDAQADCALASTQLPRRSMSARSPPATQDEVDGEQEFVHQVAIEVRPAWGLCSTLAEYHSCLA